MINYYYWTATRRMFFICFYCCLSLKLKRLGQEELHLAQSLNYHGCKYRNARRYITEISACMSRFQIRPELLHPHRNSSHDPLIWPSHASAATRPVVTPVIELLFSCAALRRHVFAQMAHLTTDHDIESRRLMHCRVSLAKSPQ